MIVSRFTVFTPERQSCNRPLRFTVLASIMPEKLYNAARLDSRRMRNAERASLMNSKLANTLVVCALFGTLLFSGCQKPATGAGLIEALFGPAGGPVVRHYTAGVSVENRPIECLILGKGADVTLIIATIHGDEPVGTPLVRHLAQYLRQHPKLLVGRTVVLMPAANPDGMARNSRYNVRKPSKP
jgi:hypothetical protein